MATTNIPASTAPLPSTAAPPAELMSWEDFEKLPDGDGFHRELIEGELQILPPPKSNHTIIADRIYRALLPAEGATGARAFAEAGYKLSTSPASWVQPDVSMLTNARRKKKEPDGYFHGAPELAIEVLSPSESASDVSRKVELMLQAGALAIWVVYPRQRKVHVHLPGATTLRLGAGDTLSLPELLPGWELPVAKLFED